MALTGTLLIQESPFGTLISESVQEDDWGEKQIEEGGIKEKGRMWEFKLREGVGIKVKG